MKQLSPCEINGEWCCYHLDAPNTEWECCFCRHKAASVNLGRPGP